MTRSRTTCGRPSGWSTRAPRSDPEQLDSQVSGTYGSILDTTRHLVGSDASYLFVPSGGTVGSIDEDVMDLA